jgi:pilus assembly protein Flp/PilA
MTVLAEFFHNEDGATAIEYGLIAALIAVGLIVAFTAFGSSLTNLFGQVRDRSAAAINSTA